MKMKIIKSAKILLTAVMIIFLAVLSAGCQKQENSEEVPEITETTFAMDTMIQMRAYGEKAQEVINESFARINEIEDEMSAHLESSQIYKVNSNPEQTVRVDEDTYRVVEKAVEYAEMTEGRFDPSIGPLVDLWGIGTKDARVPSDEEIEEAKSLINYKWIELNDENYTVKLTRERMALDLGAIAKGYAADEVRQIVVDSEIESAYVNLGGNVLVVGGKPDGSAWRVGIQDPRLERGNVMASIEVRDKTIVTSGNYERYFEEDGVLYHHILNPKTGRPARSGIISATIVTQDSFDADALSTSIFILGPDKGLELVEKTSGVEAMIINDDLGVILSSGLKDKVKLLNSDFSFIKR